MSDKAGLTNPALLQPDMPVEDVIYLIEHAPPGPWPSGWHTWQNVQEAFRRMSIKFAESIPREHHTYPKERGIAILGGGIRYFPSAWVCINLLRHYGCTLPIQLWYLGRDEMDPYMRRVVKSLDVECVDAVKMTKEYPCRIIGGWEMKPYIALYSPFEKVLVLDADNCPVRDVEYLFETKQFKDYGAIFWADNTSHRTPAEIWELFGIYWMVPLADQDVNLESGQFLIDKKRCWRELRMALWYTEHSDYVFRYVYGDKECYHLAWRLLRTEYATPSTHAVPAPQGYSHYDFDNQLIFQHRFLDKWKYDGANRHLSGFKDEHLCFKFIAELNTVWHGIPWRNPFPTEEEKQIIKELTGKRFIYRRVGYDERLMQLEARNVIGEGAAGCERRWDIQIEEDGTVILTLSSLNKPTCNLVQDENGIWRGQWLEYERMPIELIPLKD